MDDVEEVMRRARPDLPSRFDPLSERAESDLRSILASDAGAAPVTVMPAPPKAGRRWGRVSLLAACLAVMMVIAVSVGALDSPSPSYAATPKMLETTPIDESAPELLAQLAELAATQPPRDTTEFVSHEWAIDMHVGASGDVIASYILPTVTHYLRHDDGSYTVTARTGVAHTADGEYLTSPDLPQPGELIWKQTFEEHWPTFPTSAKALGDYLSEWDTLPSDAVSAEYLDSLVAALRQWKPTPPQNAAALEFLATLDGASVLGRVNDRLGREGIAFSVDPGGRVSELRTIIIISPETGQFLSAESLHVGPERPNLRSQSVISYIAWK